MDQFQKVRGPDGEVIKFPASMSDAEISAIMQQHYSQPQVPAAQTKAPVQPAALPMMPKQAPGMPQHTLPGNTPLPVKAAMDPNAPAGHRLPEMTKIDDLGFFESFVPNMKLGLTTDPVEKAKIIAEHFKQDQRFGGITQDQEGNPIIQWSGKHYVVNKPGASMTDANDAISEFVAFLGAGAGTGALAKKFVSRGLVGGALYGGTDAAKQFGTVQAGGKDEISNNDVATTAAVGGGLEAVLPPAIRMAGRGVKALSGAGKPSLSQAFPTYRPSGKTMTPANGPTMANGRPIIDIENGIPLTQGQRSGDINIIRREEALRNGTDGDKATNIMRSFDDRQRQAIQDTGKTLQGNVGLGSGFDQTNIGALGEQLQDGLISANKSSRRAVNAAYDVAKNSGEARLVAETKQQIDEGFIQVLDDFDFGAPGFEKANRLLEQFDGMSGNVADMMNWRVRLNMMVSFPATNPEDAALLAMKRTVDTAMDDALINGLIQGDQATIQAYKKATAMAKGHASLFKDSKIMLKALDRNQATPTQVIDSLFGMAKLKDNGVAVKTLKDIRRIFGGDSEHYRMLKDAFLVKTFTNKNADGINKTSAVSNWFNAQSQKQIIDVLFTKAEQAEINAFTKQVGKTITPRDAMNPSRSGWTVMSMLHQHGLISSARLGAGRLLSAGGLGMGEGLEKASNIAMAKQATEPMEQALSIPWLAPGVISGYGTDAVAQPVKQMVDDPQTQRQNANYQ